MSQSYSLQPPFADSLAQDSRAAQLGISYCGDTSLPSGDKMRGHSYLADCEHQGNARKEPLDSEDASSMSLPRHRGGPVKSLGEVHPPFGTKLPAGGSEHRSTGAVVTPVNMPGQGCEVRGSGGEGGSLPHHSLSDKELSTRSLQALSLHTSCHLAAFLLQLEQQEAFAPFYCCSTTHPRHCRALCPLVQVVALVGFD